MWLVCVCGEGELYFILVLLDVFPNQVDPVDITGVFLRQKWVIWTIRYSLIVL